MAVAPSGFSLSPVADFDRLQSYAPSSFTPMTLPLEWRDCSVTVALWRSIVTLVESHCGASMVVHASLQGLMISHGLTMGDAGSNLSEQVIQHIERTHSMDAVTASLIRHLVTSLVSTFTLSREAAIHRRLQASTSTRRSVDQKRLTSSSSSSRMSVVAPPHVSPRAGSLGSPVAMQTKAQLGDEADDGSFTVNQHVVLMQIGSGMQGEVYLAMDTDKNKLRAIKVVQRPKGANGDVTTVRGALAAARQNRRQQLEREIAIMKRCRHRNIVALYEVIGDPEVDAMYLVMQYAENGPIATLRPDGTIAKTIGEGKLAEYALQMCAGLQYLHRKGIVHRDLKPDNILLGSNDEVYLADFGTSDLFDGDASFRVNGTRGTLAFMAPELLRENDESNNSSPLGEAVDVWALGVTLYVLLYGRIPWTGATAAELMDEIASDSPVPIPIHDELTVHQRHSSDNDPFLSELSVPSSSSSLTTKVGDLPLLELAPLYATSAPPAATAWISLLRSMLHKNSSKRITVADVMARINAIDANQCDRSKTFGDENSLHQSVAIVPIQRAKTEPRHSA